MVGIENLGDLGKIDLSGVTGHINYDYFYSYDTASMMLPGTLIGFAGLLVLALFVLFIISLVKPTKTQRYRETLADMYVVGTIKKLAKEDDIDLIAELKEFSKSVKKRNLEDKYVDVVIHDELKEKVSAKMEKSLEELENKK